MKYSFIFFVAAFLLYIFGSSIKYLIVPLQKSSSSFYYAHGFFIQIAIVAVSVLSSMNYFRYSKVYKRNLAAMQYNDI